MKSKRWFQHPRPRLTQAEIRLWKVGADEEIARHIREKGVTKVPSVFLVASRQYARS